MSRAATAATVAALHAGTPGASASTSPAWPETTRPRAEERWSRARRQVACGCCDTVIATGEPLLEIVGQSWRKVRCSACAGQPVPAAIAAPAPSPVLIRAKLAAIVQRVSGTRDFKNAQGNDETGDRA